jgi:hypothetical protein
MNNNETETVNKMNNNNKTNIWRNPVREAKFSAWFDRCWGRTSAWASDQLEGKVA